MRCPLCDGLIAGGRCRECGMPYRNDEMLYHLNERRETHEKHASEKVREELARRMTPLGDAEARSKTSKDSGAGQQKAASVQRNIKSSGQDRIRTQQKKKQTSSYKQVQTSFGREKKKKGKFRWVFWILSAVVIFAPSIKDAIDARRTARMVEQYVQETQPEEVAGETAAYDEEAFDRSLFQADGDIPEAYLSSWSDEDGKTEYGLGAGFGPAEVGIQIEPGTYTAYTNNEKLTLVRVYDGRQSEERYTLTIGDMAELTLSRGDLLYLEDEESPYDSVYLHETN